MHEAKKETALTMRKGPRAEVTPPIDSVPEAGVVTVMLSTSVTTIVSTAVASARPPMRAAPPPLAMVVTEDVADSENKTKI